MTGKIPFLKMHGLGNDFGILAEPSTALNADLIRQMADRKRGIGFDQLLILYPSSKTNVHACLKVYNADGSQAEACGNGTRCAVFHLAQKYGVNKIVLEGPVGLLEGEVLDDREVEVIQGYGKLLSPDPLDLNAFSVTEGMPIDMGNPHLVVPVDDKKCESLCRIGPRLEVHPFFPNKTNVSFMRIQERNKIRIQVWERGTGITEACASAACASVVAGVELGDLDPGPVLVSLDGGVLWVTYYPGEKVRHRGQVCTVFSGDYYISDV